MSKHKVVLMGVTIVVLVLLMVVMGTSAATLGISSYFKSGLDNRPRWMLGGLRDDTGSHNAKDVFGQGFGLDQTRKGTDTVDGQFNLKLGSASLPLAGKLQTEYGGYLGQ